MARMTSSRRARISSTLSVLGLVLLGAGCRQEAPRFEGLDTRQMPEEVQADYALFAHRCSKCHSLSRPLQSGITDDKYWADYVERMRRQPGSAISLDDTVPILRFLHYYSTGQIVRRDWQPPPPPQGVLLDGGVE
jgi:hypothetical protein